MPGTLVDHVNRLGLAYLSALHHDTGGSLVQELRRRFAGPLVMNSGFASATTLADAPSCTAWTPHRTMSALRCTTQHIYYSADV